jgi:predicted permease
MHALSQTLRRLARQPGFVATALLILAVCVGANLLIFAVLHAALLRPLPFPDADRLVTVFNSYPKAGLERNAASVRDYFSRRKGGLAAFESVAAFRYSSETLGEPGSMARRPTLRITPEFFDVLGVGLALGRGFSEAEMNPGAESTVIVSDRYWREHLGGTASALGRSVEISGARATVVGVLPPGFRFLSSSADLYLPLVSTAEHRALNALHGVHADMLARLRPGVSLEQALAQLEVHQAADAVGYPWAREVSEAGFFMTIAPLQADHVAHLRPVLLLLQAGALGLLLIGGVNLLNLLLVRASADSKALGVRRALGARGGDLLRLVMLETTLLCFGGTALGLLLAGLGLQWLGSMEAAALPLSAPLGLGSEIVLGGLGLAIVLSLALALPVAWLNQRRSVGGALQSQSRGASADRLTQRVRQGFTIAQIALAFVLLAALKADPGFRAEFAIAAQLDLPPARYADTQARSRFAERALERLAAVPGVSAVGFSTNVPVRGRGSDNDVQAMHVPGYVPQPGVSPLLHYRYGIAGDYFESLQIPLQQGRTLSPSEVREGARVAVVDADFARFYWPDGNALGQRVFDGPDPRAADEAFTVVGVVAPVKQTELGQRSGNGAIYLPYAHLPHAEVFLTVATAQDTVAALPSVRAALAELDPQLALDQIRPMQARIDDTLVARRTPAVLAGGFAAAALLLAGIGSFGVLSFSVALRRREIGMRMALGAQPLQILRSFLALGLVLLIAGAALGGLASWLFASAVEHLLANLPDVGVSALLLSASVLGAVTLLACALPAWRAARISPLSALSAD